MIKILFIKTTENIILFNQRRRFNFEMWIIIQKGQTLKEIKFFVP